MKYRCYLCQHEWEYQYAPQYHHIQCPKCEKALGEYEARKPKDAYWNARDDFEHDIRELFGQFISPEEFEKKWRPKLQSSNRRTRK